MSREIKFRAWDTALDKMLDMKEIERSGMNLFVLCEGVNLVKLMQFTGLRDKIGVEIYEGDVVEDEWDGYRWQVVYGDYARFVMKSLGSPHAEWLLPDEFEREDDKGVLGIEVIGNIYENPDLLEAAAHDA